jgi:hypothetical protein
MCLRSLHFGTEFSQPEHSSYDRLKKLDRDQTAGGAPRVDTL